MLVGLLEHVGRAEGPPLAWAIRTSANARCHTPASTEQPSFHFPSAGGAWLLFARHGRDTAGPACSWPLDCVSAPEAALRGPLSRHALTSACPNPLFFYRKHLPEVHAKLVALDIDPMILFLKWCGATTLAPERPVLWFSCWSLCAPRLSSHLDAPSSLRCPLPPALGSLACSSTLFRWKARCVCGTPSGWRATRYGGDQLRRVATCFSGPGGARRTTTAKYSCANSQVIFRVALAILEEVGPELLQCRVSPTQASRRRLCAALWLAQMAGGPHVFPPPPHPSDKTRYWTSPRR